ncbi:LADA_0C09098g1_1 [Lachancea dasiensis]|uniref:Dolichyl-diphosphooligosaccharide--protein glycosyltransferase subunit OST2 n=1 Tax=Lachancea dasiensis TaxID=1072105 RepID=A0A1G4J0H1_9SACH|nr:LADA_0C09098g1_1 [Lachancea dasiensis]
MSKSSVSSVSAASASVASSSSKFAETFSAAWAAYRDQVGADPRLKLVDALLAFLVVVGVAQFGFVCAVRDSFPLNAFLAGFSACVGQFVLAVSLRMQWVESFAGIRKERAFMEFVGGSLVLHFVCLHFVN